MHQNFIRKTYLSGKHVSFDVRRLHVVFEIMCNKNTGWSGAGFIIKGNPNNCAEGNKQPSEVHPSYLPCCVSRQFSEIKEFPSQFTNEVHKNYFFPPS